ncbi:MAG: hypothetical protein IJT16_13075 [Lachnospiraceae bacterium]|nr:hypothetical protein [Lachnospiraceae bacterium]
MIIISFIILLLIPLILISFGRLLRIPHFISYAGAASLAALLVYLIGGRGVESYIYWVFVGAVLLLFFLLNKVLHIGPVSDLMMSAFFPFLLVYICYLNFDLSGEIWKCNLVSAAFYTGWIGLIYLNAYLNELTVPRHRLTLFFSSVLVFFGAVFSGGLVYYFTYYYSSFPDWQKTIAVFCMELVLPIVFAAVFYHDGRLDYELFSKEDFSYAYEFLKSRQAGSAPDYDYETKESDDYDYESDKKEKEKDPWDYDYEVEEEAFDELSEAMRLFHITDPSQLTRERLRATRRRLLKRYHPDNFGGDDTIAKSIGSAYELLLKEL